MTLCNTIVETMRDTGRQTYLFLTVLWILSVGIPVPGLANEAVPSDFEKDIMILSSFGDRSTGTPGCNKAAAHIQNTLSKIGHTRVESHHFAVPVRIHGESSLVVTGKGISLPIRPMRSNAISPGTTSPQGIEGPLIYVGRGELDDFNGEEIEGSVVLMDLDSGKNWLHAASLGAKALIYLDHGTTKKAVFEEKMELTPIQFPRFWIPGSEFLQAFGSNGIMEQGSLASHARLTSRVTWQEVTGENIYCLIPGTNPLLQEELVLIEAFYDSTALVYDRSPGADEACSAATLLELARMLKRSPPARSVLLVATSGHAQTMAGMRELFWSASARSKDLRKIVKQLKTVIKKTGKTIAILKGFSFENPLDKEMTSLFREAVGDRIKVEVDSISRRLMRLRLEEKGSVKPDIIKELAQERLTLRRLGFRTDFRDLSPEEATLLTDLIPQSMQDRKAILSDAEMELGILKGSRKFRSLIRSKELAVTVSLHLSSHGDGFGAFNQGWLYPLKPTINRTAAYSTVEQVLRNAGSSIEQSPGAPSLFHDTLRPSRSRSWQSYFLDKPPLGGEVSALAGYLGLSLVTVNDARPAWGTPIDVPEMVNFNYALQQSNAVCDIMRHLLDEEVIHHGELPRNGFSTVTGRANFIRHGELFPDQPAPGSIILTYQGPGIYHTMVDHMGLFRLKGMADKRHVAHKAIIEGYRFDPENGSIVWAIDKKQTGKKSYRVKMQRRSMETDLVMFACKGTTLFNLLEPRNFHHMTKIQVLDGRREAPPLRYWWSRIDTRKSVIASIFLESGTPLKMTLSDSALKKKMILTNAVEGKPNGKGYIIDEWPFIHNTAYRTARDMWKLIGPRIENLEKHGIYNERIRLLHEEGVAALDEAESALETKRYDRFYEASSRSWALAGRVYDHVEKTQKDVLFGVLFYIALFVPFAFCMERLLFCYTNINKRIIAFSALLILLIFVIYMVHPAFQLAYSPLVVILAFFIIALSLVVTLIIFFRFEEEMTRLQSRAVTLASSELGRWKAFVASFLLGVSNLRRRRIRTGLTCATLIILTFTIMSFTAVKSMRHHARIHFTDTNAYRGFLLKKGNWASLPPESLAGLSIAFEKDAFVGPRVWLELEDRTRATRIPVSYQDRTYEAKGLIGLSPEEQQVTGISEILIGGRWFQEKDKYSILLSERMAGHLGINPDQGEETVVSLWGIPFTVIGVYSGKTLQERLDLDGEPLTPVIFPSEASMEMTEIELEAQESGEDIKTFQSRYQHIPGDLTAIIPHRTLLSMGGCLKSVAVLPGSKEEIQVMARNLVDRFGLSLFSGEQDGTYLYHASDTMSYSGVPNIIIPLVISIFIVLNTMIGSVYERKREIAVYTSVGLAPSHISFLFIAEAMAFAVLSVVIGYLLAQTSAFLFSGSDLWTGITVNYSSMAGVGAMILVILVVLVSVIYPSKVAGEIAIPDVNRSWKLPEADGLVLDLTLPFLVKYLEHRSIGGYIFNYFKEHLDVTHGLFSTGNLKIASVCQTPSNNRSECDTSHCNHDVCLRLHSRVWLAPFDLGITQDVDIMFCPAAEEKEFLEIKIHLIRDAGEANAWRRINKGFLNQLRKQLLMWRSLDEKYRNYYEEIILREQEICET